MSLTDTPLEDIDFRKADDETLRRYIELVELECDTALKKHVRLTGLMEGLRDEVFKRFKEAQCKQSPQSA